MNEDPDLRHRVNVVRSEIPAVTHVDYSARLQTVDEERNPRFTRLLEAFDRLTGCPVLVNTSFNVRGEPIVCTPEDAYRCFLATDMDVLVLEDVVVDQGCGRTGSRSGGPRAVPGPVPARLTEHTVWIALSIKLNAPTTVRRGYHALVRHPVPSAQQDLAAVRRAVAGLFRRPGPLGRAGARHTRAGASLRPSGADCRPGGA